MITFRFYLVSLIAVFLSLALGIVLGSTVIDRAIVDALRKQVDDVEDGLRDRQRENDELRQQVERFEGFVEAVGPFAVSGRLEGAEVAVVAERGVAEDVVEQSVLLIQQAGASTPGILWLEAAWSLDDTEERARLSEAVDIPERTAGVMRDSAWEVVVDHLAGPTLGDLPGGTGEAEPVEEPDPLVALAEAGFLSYQPVGDADTNIAGLAGLGSRVVLVTGIGSDIEPADVVVGMAEGLVEADVPTVVAEAHRDVESGPGRGTAVVRVREAEGLGDVVSTVNALDLPEGRVATALALDDLGRDVVGHYGYGLGADRVLPEWSELNP